MYYTYAYCDPTTKSNLLKDFLIESEPFYIGYGSGDRMFAHLKDYMNPKSIKSNPIKTSKIKKLISCGIMPEIKKLKSFSSKDDAIAHEIFLINEIGTKAVVQGIDNRGPLSNLHVGGNGGSIPKSIEGCLQLSQKLKGRIISTEWRQKISEAKLGNSNHSEETKALISKNTSKALMDSPEARLKISQRHKGIPKTEEHANKIKANITKINKDPIMLAKKLATKIANNTLNHSNETKLHISEKTKEAMQNPEIKAKMKASSQLRWANESQRTNLSNKMAKTFKLTNRLTNESFIITNLSKYCKDNSTYEQAVYKKFIVEKL